MTTPSSLGLLQLSLENRRGVRLLSFVRRGNRLRVKQPGKLHAGRQQWLSLGSRSLQAFVSAEAKPTVYREKAEAGKGFSCRLKGSPYPWTPRKCRRPPPPPDPPRRCQRGPSLFPRRRLEVRAPARGGAGPAARHVAVTPGTHPAPVRQQRALRRGQQRCGGRGRGGLRLDPRGYAPAPGR